MSEWITHKGSVMPIGPYERVDVRTRDRTNYSFFDAGEYRDDDGSSWWEHNGSRRDIVEYRLRPRGLAVPTPAPETNLMGWRSIETLRRNQSAILQCWWLHQPTAPFVFEGYLDWDGSTWRHQDGSPLRADITSPAYWQPMPTPLSATSAAEGPQQ